MKRSTHFYAFTFALLLISTLAQATGFVTINGLKFLIDTENNKASLVANDLKYSGDIIVPEIITSGDKDYPVTSLRDRCFEGCSGLTSTTIPASVTSLGDLCFYGCSGLTLMTIPSSVTSMGVSCFEACSQLTSITISPSVTYLGRKCFGFCSALTSIMIPPAVTSLGELCFVNCSGLRSLIIPSSVTSLENNCFDGCSNLLSITCYAITPPICHNSFSGYDPLICLLNVPKESIDKYKSADEWNAFSYINAIEGSEPGGDIKKCDVPSITFIDGILHFACVTSGARYHYTITDKDMANDAYSQSGEVALSAIYEISVYATVGGYMASEKSTATLYWLPISEPTNINSTSTRGLIATCNSGIITISGLKSQENVTFYTVNGEQLGTAAAIEGVATYAVNATYDIVIAKFGDSSIKIVTK